MTAPIRITLAWPDKALSPNARKHWRTVRSTGGKASDDAFWATRSAMGAQVGPSFTKIEHDGVSDIILRQIAHPPDQRHRDRDNLDSSLKKARDGIALALGVNDKFFRPTGIEWAEPVAGGKIVIEVTP